MAKMTIYVPDDLKRRMDGAEGVNWSPLACKSFESELARLGRRKEVQVATESVINRLRATKGQTKRAIAESDRDRGYEAGARWASDKATAPELERIEEAHAGEDLERHRTQIQHMHIQLAALVTGKSNPAKSDRTFWDVAGPGVGRLSDDFVMGFIEGALDVWLEVRDDL
jgi:hypothetical protein